MQIFNSSYISKAYTAKLFYEEIKDNSYIVLGGQSPWNKGVVPLNSPSLSQITDAFLYVYVHKVSLVKLDLNGELTVNNDNFMEFVDPVVIDRITSMLPNAIYFNCFISNEAINSLNTSITNYRTIGLYTNVTENPTVNITKESGAYFSLTPTSFILDKVFNYSAISIDTLRDQTIQIIKSF